MSSTFFLSTNGRITIVGDDTDELIQGQDKSDKLSGGGGNDSLSGGLGNDVLSGGIGNDTLDGGSDFDIMSGSIGNDTYIVDHKEDRVNEQKNQGIDTVITSVDYESKAYTERIFAAPGTTPINIQGQQWGETLTGNDGANLINANLGRDTIYGGAGNDTVIPGGDDDHVTLGEGADVIQSDRNSPYFGGITQKDVPIITIEDFNPEEDKIVWFENDYLPANSPGIRSMLTDNFSFAIADTIAQAEISPALVIYVQSEGLLFLNPNSTAPGFSDWRKGGAVYRFLNKPDIKKTSISVLPRQ